ncbi:MAG: peptidase S41, partial [Caldithrix sp.]|nr:peptidase S41 [Caldithrix sp.]
MKRILVVFFALLTFSFAESHLMRFADVQGNKIVFTFENDLWLVEIDEQSFKGVAQRITRSNGIERFAKFSSDGSKIAFTANYEGNNDVYLMDLNRVDRTPIRLTYHPHSDLVLDWMPDGEHILFRAAREYPFRGHKLYKVAATGGFPEKLSVDRAGLASVSPDGKQLAYNRISREFRTWKRHQGGTAQDIWVGSLDKMNYKPVTTFPGTDNFPMWYNDYIYFVSDRSDGTLNLYKFHVPSAKITRLTHYNDYDIKYPSIGDRYIVYQYAETLYLFDLENEQTIKLNISVPTDRSMARLKPIDGSKYTGSFALSPDGNRVVMEMRGEVINLPAEKGPVYNLTNTSGIREKGAIWSPDGNNVVYLSDK